VQRSAHTEREASSDVKGRSMQYVIRLMSSLARAAALAALVGVQPPDLGAPGAYDPPGVPGMPLGGGGPRKESP